MALESFRGCLFHSHCEYNEILLICGNMKLQSLLDMLKTPDSFRLKKLSVVHAKTTVKRASFSKGSMAYLRGMKGSGDNETNLI